jgi:hypothetical protein
MKILLIVLTPLLSACSIFGINDTEQLSYKVIITEKNKEIRSYDSFIKAQISLSGTMTDNRSDSFKILAGYIFGKNVKKSKISMTSPVVTKEGKGESEEISMTSPVVMKEANNESVMFFKMPSKYTLETLPKPEDKRITISEEQSKTYAVITYSGSWDKVVFESKKKELIAWINANDSYRAVSVAKYAGYNPPWTLPWFRKNEVLIEIEK